MLWFYIPQGSMQTHILDAPPYFFYICHSTKDSLKNNKNIRLFYFIQSTSILHTGGSNFTSRIMVFFVVVKTPVILRMVEKPLLKDQNELQWAIRKTFVSMSSKYNKKKNYYRSKLQCHKLIILFFDFTSVISIKNDGIIYTCFIYISLLKS